MQQIRNALLFFESIKLATTKYKSPEITNATLLM
jgi:hypothetical protein